MKLIVLIFWIFSFYVVRPHVTLADETSSAAARLLINEIQIDFPQYKKEVASLFASPLGYAFLGEKPVSLTERAINPLLLRVLQNYFYRSNYLFKTISPYYDKVEVLLLNKKNFFELCKNNRSIMRFLKKKGCTAQGFLRRIENSKSSFLSLCDFDTEVEGIFLGFGSENAATWTRWAQLGFFLCVGPFKEYSSTPSPVTITSHGHRIRVPRSFRHTLKKNEKFDSLYAEWSHLYRRKKEFPLPQPPLYLSLPQFYFWNEDCQEIKGFIMTREVLAEFLYQLDPSFVVSEPF